MIWKSLSFLCANIHKAWFSEVLFEMLTLCELEANSMIFFLRKIFQEKNYAHIAFLFLVSIVTSFFSCSRFWFVETYAILILIGARNFLSTNGWAWFGHVTRVTAHAFSGLARSFFVRAWSSYRKFLTLF